MGIVDDLVDKWEEHEERGEPVALEVLCRDHPELLEDVRKQIEALQAVDRYFGTSQLFGDSISAAEIKLVPPEFVDLPGRFQILQLHASGGIGNVYRAHDKILNRPVAIKFPKRSNMSKDQLARFQREALITGQLDHPGIVPILALDASKASEPCYVMRFINGKTLHESVQESLKRLAKNDLRDYLRSQDLRHHLQSFVALCNIVAYAHGQGVIHRDIKPNNVMLGPFAETLLLDWGIAKNIRQHGSLQNKSSLNAEESSPFHHELVDTLDDPLSGEFTKTGQTFGTPAYASPEQLIGSADASRESTDIFSLGATLFFILCGRSPIEVAGWEFYMQLCRSPQSDLSRLLPKGIPAGLKAVCRHCLQIRPNDRYSGVLQLGVDIDRFLARESISVHRESIAVRFGRAARKRPASIGAAIATSIALLIGSIVASLFFQAKSHELEVGNQKLVLALAHAEKANQLGLESLRNMFDNVVVMKFRQKTALSDHEHRFLSAALEQYRAMAAIQNDSERSRSIRAESHARMARILETLSQDEESAEQFSKAIDAYQTLAQETGRMEYWKGWTDSLRSFSALQISRGKVDDALFHARRGLEEIEKKDPFADDPTSYYRLYNQAVFRAIVGSCEAEKTGDRQAAVAGQREAIRLLEQCLHENPEETLQVLDQLSHCNMALGNALGDLPTEKDIPMQQLYATTNAVCYSFQLYGVFPNEPHSISQYVEASLARCEALQRCGTIRGALEETRRAIPLAQELVERFPLYESFQHNLSRILVLEAQLAVSEGEMESADRALERAAGIPIKIRELNLSISILLELVTGDSDSKARRFLLSRFYSLRAAYFEKYTQDWVSARADCNEALQSLDALNGEREWRERALQQRFVVSLLNCRICAVSNDTNGSKNAFEEAETILTQLSKVLPDQSKTLEQNLREHRKYVSGKEVSERAEIMEGELP